MGSYVPSVFATITILFIYSSWKFWSGGDNGWLMLTLQVILSTRLFSATSAVPIYTHSLISMHMPLYRMTYP